jgi:hypothetical protein
MFRFELLYYILTGVKVLVILLLNLVWFSAIIGLICFFATR